MAKGFKTGGRDFKPGNSGNPNGRPRTPEDLKEARLANAHDLEAVIYKYMDYSAENIKKALTDPTTPARDLVVLKILAESISRGDHQRLDFLLNRTIGKVREQIDHNVNMKPSILIKNDGTEVHFLKAPKDDDEK